MKTKKDVPVLGKVLDTEIYIEIRDSDGNIVDVRRGKNRETIWAKLHTPTDNLNMAFVMDKPSVIFGRPLSDVNLTAFNQVDNVRWPWYSVGFSRSGNTYTATFSWTNTGNSPVYIYALMSYRYDNLYTIYNMEDNPIEVLPNYVVSGKYLITYDASTPSAPSDGSFSTDTINKNGIVYSISTELGKGLREYKYTRIFPKTSDYTGIDISDTGIISQMDIDITSSDQFSRAFGDMCCGELFYKCLQSGSPGGAKVVRYINYQCPRESTRFVMGNFPYRITGGWNISGDCTHELFQYIEATADQEPTPNTSKEIYPWRFKFPETIERIGELAIPRWTGNGSDYSRATTYLFMNPRVVYVNSNRGPFQQIMYLYWDDNPSFNIWVRSARDLYDRVYLYINGTKYIPVVTKVSSHANNNLYKCEFDLSGLSAGSGVVIFTINDDRHVCYWRCHRGDYTYITNPTVIAVESSMWGYVVPFAGFLKPDTSEITSGWISSGVASYQGTNMDISFVIDEANVGDIGLVNDLPLSDIEQYTDYLYWVWVTEEQANKLAGEFCLGGKTKLQNIVFHTNYNDSSTLVVTPIYLRNNYIALKWQGIGYLDVDLIDFSSITPLWDDMLSLPQSDHLNINLPARSVEFITDRPFDPALEFDDYGQNGYEPDRWKSYVIRKQGVSPYEYRIPKALTPYTEGQATIEHGGDIYEYETTLETNETIGNLTINITDSSVFAQDEYFSFPISDGRGFLIVDSLETWKRFTGGNFPTTDLFPLGEESSGTDVHIDSWDNNREVISGNFYLARSSTVDIIDSSIKLHPDHTHYFVVNLKYFPSTSILYLIAVPKWLEKEGGERRYVDVESIMVSNGHQIIPWSLYQYGNHTKDCLYDDLLKDYWIVRLDEYTLKDLFGRDGRNTEIILHVYFTAKAKEEILPIELEVYLNSLESKTFSYNDSLCWCILKPGTNEGEVINVAKHLLKPTPSPNNITLGDVSDALKFTASSQSRIDIPIRDDVCGGLMHDHAWAKGTIDTWFKVDELPNDWAVLFGCKYVWLVINNEGWLYIGWANSDIGHPDRFARVGYVGDLNWHHVALIKHHTFYSIYLDGVRKRVIKPSIDTDDEFTLWSGRVFSESTLRIGLASDNSYPFSGQIKNFHIGLTTCWDPNAEFIYYPSLDDSWEDDPATWQQPQGLSKDVVVRFELPYALDDAIDLKDQSGNTPIYCILDALGHKVEGEDSKGNVVYVKFTIQPDFKQANNKYSFLDVGFYLGPQATFCGEDLYMYVSFFPQWLDTSAVELGALRYNLHCNSVTDANGLIVCDEPLFKYKWKVTGNLIQRIMLPRVERRIFKLQSSQSSTISDPEQVFDTYVLPTTVGEKATIMTISNNDFQTTPTLFRVHEPIDTNYIQIDPQDVVNTVEMIVMSDVLFDGCNKTKYWEGHILAHSDVVVRSMFPYYGLWFRDKVVLKKHLAFRYILMYESPVNVISNYKALRCNTGMDCDELFIKDVTKANVWGENITDITDISGEKELLLVTPQDASREVPAWELELKEGDFKILTYYIDDFDSLLPYYKNNVGNHVLSDPSKQGLLYHLYHSHFNPNCKFGKLYYMYARDSEVASLLSSRTVEMPMTKIGFINSTESDIVNAGVSYTSLPTDTVVIRRYAVTNLFMFPNAFAAGGSVGYTHRLPLSLHYSSNNLIDILSPDRIYKDIRIASYVRWDDNSRTAPSITYAREEYTQPMLHHSDIQLWDTHSLLWQIFNLRWVFIGDEHNVRETAKKAPMVIMNEGTLDDDAAWVDFRVVPNVNMYFNIIWDPNKIPVTSVTSFGTWSLIGAISIRMYKDDFVAMFPLLRFENENTGDVKWFGLEEQQLTPIDITDIVENIDTTTDAFSTYPLYQFIDSYKLAQIQSFVPFDTLISEYNEEGWVVSFAWLVYVSDFDFSASGCIIKSISVQPSLTDTTLYKVVDYCYANTKEDMLVDDYTELVPSTYEVKVYNKANKTITNAIVRISLEEIPINNYVNGIVAYIDGSAVPTIYEIDEKGRLGNSFAALKSLDKKYIHVKIPTILPNAIKTIVLQDESNTYTPDAVYDYYYEFITLDADQWSVTRLFPPYDGTVQDVDAGIGMTSTTDRLVGVYYDDVYVEDGSVVMKGCTVALSSVQQFQQGGLLQVGYDTDTYTEPIMWCSDGEPQIELIEAPTYYVQHHGISYVKVKDIQYGQLYHEEGTDRANNTEVFETCKLPEGTKGWVYECSSYRYMVALGMHNYTTYPDLAYLWCMQARYKTPGWYGDNYDNTEGCCTVLRREANVHWYLEAVNNAYTDYDSDIFVGLSRRFGALGNSKSPDIYFYSFTSPSLHKFTIKQDNMMEYFTNVPILHEGVIPIKDEYTTENRRYYTPTEPMYTFNNGIRVRLNPSIYSNTLSNPTQTISKNTVVEDYYYTLIQGQEGYLGYGAYFPMYGFGSDVEAGWNEFYLYYDSQDATNVNFLNDISPRENITYDNVYDQLGRYVFVDVLTRIKMDVNRWEIQYWDGKCRFTSHFIPPGFIMHYLWNGETCCIFGYKNNYRSVVGVLNRFCYQYDFSDRYGRCLDNECLRFDYVGLSIFELLSANYGGRFVCDYDGYFNHRRHCENLIFQLKNHTYMFAHKKLPFGFISWGRYCNDGSIGSFCGRGISARAVGMHIINFLPYPINYTLIAGDEETGTWEIDGYTYNKRRKLKYYTPYKSNYAVLYFDYYLTDDTRNFRIVKETTDGGATLPAYNSTKPTIMTVKLESSNVIIKVEPIQGYDKWIFGSKTETAKAVVPENSRLHFVVKTAEGNTFRLHWVRYAGQGDSVEIVQLMKKDVKLLIKNEPTCWYLFDSTDTQQSSSTNIQSHIDSVWKRNRSAIVFFKYLPFPFAGLMLKGALSLGRSVQYGP